MQDPTRGATAALDGACETTSTCAGIKFCPVRAAIVTLLGLLGWVALSRATFVDGEGWAAAAGSGFDRAASLLSVGIKPWIVVVIVLQVLAALARPISEWLCARTSCERADVYKWIAALSLIAFVVAANARVTWAHMLAVRPGAHELGVVPGPDVMAGLLLGSIAALGIVIALQKLGPGTSFTLIALFGVVGIVAPRLSTYADYLRTHWFLGPIQLALMVCAGFLLVWLVGMTYEAPADLTPGGRDAPAIQVPVLVVGVVPLVLSEFALRVLRRALIGIGGEFDVLGQVARWSSALLDPNGILTPLVQLALVWLLTSLTFSLLYPTHRLETVFGLSRERIDESLESFLDGLLIQNALILCGVYVLYRFCLGSFQVLGLTPAGFVVLVAGAAAVRRNVLARRALEEQSGGLVCARTVLGLLEGEVARARLAAAGIPAYLNGWTAQELHPVTIAGMGEVEVLVPQRSADEARKLLS